MVKILHCADLHLDSPFTMNSAEKAEVRRRELRGSFSSMMLYAKTEAVDIVLMAGDIFDSAFITRDTVSLVLREFSANPGCRFVISPGNHDPFTSDGVYAKTVFPPNVYIFDSDKTMQCFHFDDLNTDVYGYAFTSPTLNVNPFSGLRPQNSERLNLLCAHGDMLSPISASCPITERDIRDSAFDYAALGHIHNSDGIKKLDNTYYGYSGCLEGRDYGECGYKGVFVAELEKSGGVVSAKIKGQKFSHRRFETAQLNVTGISDLTQLYAAVTALISSKKFGQDTALRIYLNGEVDPELRIPVSAAEAELGAGLFELELVDRTLPLYNTELLSSDPTLRGAFYIRLLPVLQEGTPEERRIAAEALKLGLAAISGADLSAT